MPDEPEVHGLHALVLLQDARRDARVSADGRLVLLEDQDRSLWDDDEIEQGARRSSARSSCAARAVPAAGGDRVAARRATRPTGAQIALLYSRLLDFTPSPVVELNRAVAVAMAHGPEEGLALADSIDGLDDYYLLHSTRADLLRRLERSTDAAAAYDRALALAPSEVERVFLPRRRGALSASQPTSRARSRASAPPPPRRPNSRFAYSR